MEDYDFKILDSVIRVNDRQKTILLPKILDHFNNDIAGKKLAIWGLAFKPETDDIREAPAVYLIEELLKRGAKLAVYDPEAMPNIEKRFGDALDYKKTMYDTIENNEALVICTEWSIFRTPDYQKLRKLLINPLIFDGRNLYNVKDMQSEGFTYISIGRKKTNK